MRYAAAERGNVTSSGQSLQIHWASPWSDSPRAATSVKAPSDFAFPGGMTVYIPSQKRARKYSHFNTVWCNRYTFRWLTCYLLFSNTPGKVRDYPVSCLRKPSKFDNADSTYGGCEILRHVNPPFGSTSSNHDVASWSTDSAISKPVRSHS